MGRRMISSRSAVVVGMSLSLLSVRVDRRRADAGEAFDGTTKESREKPHLGLIG
jgi:hypothetical protein